MNIAGTALRTHLAVASVSRHFGPVVAVDGVTLDVARGETLGLLGPSGCGKTTLLRVIAGLERPDAGTVTIAGRRVAGKGSWVQPEERNVGLVFQSGALFPHMTVGENVAYGLGRRFDRARVAEVLAMVDLGGLDDRMPGTLSGGQAQRVALARALAPQPDVLLLDEPFAALDAELRARIRSDVAELLRHLDVTTIFVTHDQEEAFVVGDRAAVMRHGRIEQLGTPTEIYDHPVNPWVARFVGEANLLRGMAQGDTVATAIGELALNEAQHGPCRVVLRPEYLAIEGGGPGRVAAIEFYGHDTKYTLEFGDETVSARALAAPFLAVDDAVSVRYVGPKVTAFAAAGSARRPASSSL